MIIFNDKHRAALSNILEHCHQGEDVVTLRGVLETASVSQDEIVQAVMARLDNDTPATELSNREAVKYAVMTAIADLFTRSECQPLATKYPDDMEV